MCNLASIQGKYTREKEHLEGHKLNSFTKRNFLLSARRRLHADMVLFRKHFFIAWDKATDSSFCMLFLHVVVFSVVFQMAAFFFRD